MGMQVLRDLSSGCFACNFSSEMDPRRTLVGITGGPSSKLPKLRINSRTGNGDGDLRCQWDAPAKPDVRRAVPGFVLSVTSAFARIQCRFVAERLFIESSSDMCLRHHVLSPAYCVFRICFVNISRQASCAHDGVLPPPARDSIDHFSPPVVICNISRSTSQSQL